ncbi:hypothetical protein CODIS_33940 [Candidatus Thiodiazotropha endolucinida]|uniref:Uncharacterized protein n=1 Tax=Candidatus Thiodiazotropha endolucinida TaxID=1655433 RepID=A0A7Z1ADV8_9GAMM|nr:hypothetical protein CODIS_33940 [Candidatus Thiodiazotropha endolucinida]
MQTGCFATARIQLMTSTAETSIAVWHINSASLLSHTTTRSFIVKAHHPFQARDKSIAKLGTNGRDAI